MRAISSVYIGKTVGAADAAGKSGPKSSGTVVAWGDNEYGQADVPKALSDVIAIAAANTHNLALKQDGTVVAWGDNKFGQANVPEGLRDVIAIAATHSNSLALVKSSP